MKTLPRFLLAVTLLSPAAGILRAAAPAVPALPAGRVTVVFDHPEDYTDLKDNLMDVGNVRGRDRFLPPLKEHLERRAERLLPAGQKLTVTFTNIDLAGDFEPWHGPAFSDVRIVKDIYVPRLAFTFTLTDANGQVLKQGERKLLDGAFQMRVVGGSNSDLLRYEKEMLNDWLRSEFPARKG